MRFSNIRIGLATNSSSSHSIVVIPDRVLWGYHDENHEYGWENFILDTPRAKTEYLAAMFGDMLLHNYGDSIGPEMIKRIFGVYDWSPDWYVDHNSHFALPRTHGGNPNLEFLFDLVEFISRKDVYIIGGNDSDDDSEMYELKQNQHPVCELWRETRGKKSGDWWTLFSDGGKFRLTFKDDAEEEERSETPELVDIKITDYCPFECPFCYQDSTVHGRHATLDDIIKIADELQRLEVFEVALGGGEPTLHPDFPKIIEIFAERNIVPNFTTKVLPNRWSKELLNASRRVGSFAYSPSSLADIERFDEACRGLFARGVIHHIVGGGVPTRDAIELCRRLKIRLTLLGYKNVGRGEVFGETEDELSPEMLKGAWFMSVDTAFVDRYGDLLKEAGVDERLIVPGEGRFSMYIDAVELKAGISSYHNRLMKIPTSEGELDILAAWQRIWGLR